MTQLLRIDFIFLLLLCSRFSFADPGIELSGIDITPGDSTTSLQMQFQPEAPERFVVYLLEQQNTSILVTEFVDAGWQEDLFAESVRPLTHVQVTRDSLMGHQILRVMYYLEESVPFRYRWNEQTLIIELTWKNPVSPVAVVPSLLSDISLFAPSDSSSQVSFTFNTTPADYTISLSADRTSVLALFHNTIAAHQVSRQLSSNLLQVTVSAGEMVRGLSFVKIVAKSPVPITCNDSLLPTGLLVSVGRTPSVPAITPSEIVAQTAATDTVEKNAPAVVTQLPPTSFLSSSSRRAWTYIGLGSAVAMGGAITGIILSRRDTQDTSQPQDIPPIEDILSLPSH